MKNIYSLFTAIFLGIFLLTSCNNSDTMDEVTEPGSLTIMMESKFGTEDISVSPNFSYSSTTDNQINFTRFEYIISNVTLELEDGSSYLVPNSYYIMGQRSDSQIPRELIEINDIPAGTYTGISFSVGVDPTTNANTDTYEKGDLQAGIGMDWGWASGYKFIRWDGQYFNTIENSNINFSFHIGTDDNYRTVEKDFAQAITINSEMQTMLNFNVRADAVFDAINLNDLGLNFPPSEPVKTFTGVMFGPVDKATVIADAYADMFVLWGTENNAIN